ncbi:MAG: acyltransferase [Nitrospinae bacterium]|nr:acyltransferase [Nitrospinota bacterium]MBF0635349.1 acyltransferase [Nitrospinota bacterium]
MSDKINIQIQHEYGGKGKSRLEQYQDLILGTRSIWFLIKFELVILLFSRIPGALGIVLRKIFYPMIIGRVGRGVVFGMDVSLRHPLKIEIGNGSIIDDGVLLDAKGSDNTGIIIGENCYVGRGTIFSCKEGDIILKDYANISTYCNISSNSRIVIGEKSLLGPYVSLFATRHNFDDVDEAILDQGWTSEGIEIANDCWLGAKVTVLDGVNIGESAVIGAGAIVTASLPQRVVAVGSPARVVKVRE